MKPFDVGDRPTIRAHIQDPDTGVDVDPTAVVIRALDPTGTEVSPALTVIHDSAGHYSALLALTQHGEWKIRVETTGAYTAAEETTIKVQASAF